jgi:hypothetical protein
MPPVKSIARCGGLRLVHIAIAREPDEGVADKEAADRPVVVGWRPRRSNSTP